MRDFTQEIASATTSGISEVFDFQSEDHVNSIDVALSVTAGAGTTPTLDITVEASFDKETWFDTGVAFTQATGVTKELLNTASKTGQFIRFNYTIAGGGWETFDFDLFAVVKG